MEDVAAAEARRETNSDPRTIRVQSAPGQPLTVA